MDLIFLHAFVFPDMLGPERMIFAQNNPYAKQHHCRGYKPYHDPNTVHHLYTHNAHARKIGHKITKKK